MKICSIHLIIFSFFCHNHPKIIYKKYAFIGYSIVFTLVSINEKFVVFSYSTKISSDENFQEKWLLFPSYSGTDLREPFYVVAKERFSFLNFLFLLINLNNLKVPVILIPLMVSLIYDLVFFNLSETCL